MKLDLAVIGRGAVTPAGVGLSSLGAEKPEPILVPSVRRPDLAWPVLRVNPNEAALLRWQREPRLRRASALTLYLIEAAAQALDGVSESDRAETGLVVALSVGCIVYTHRFFEGILAQGRKMASPALFPETVFNSPGSHVAAALKLNGAASALVGDETAWVSAIQTAAIWLRQERVRQVLVLGGEEFDPLVLDAYRSARWLGPAGRPGPRGFVPGEGAAALLLRAARAEDEAVITDSRDGFLHRNRTEAAAAARKLFAGVDPARPVWRSAAHTWLGSLEEKMAATPPTPAARPYLGEASTASAGWNTLRALDALRDSNGPIFCPVWGLSHQLGALTLAKPVPGLDPGLDTPARSDILSRKC
jgi:hypothetical protein